ncbi:TPA: glucosyltransferase domain-containing protein [Streptococcus suis]|nr:glucosyltransferase domain-containing protein [Streptococcus suis]
MIKRFFSIDKVHQFLQNKFTANREILLVCILYTFLFGLVTHSFMAMNSSFSHDSLPELFAANEWKLKLGRVFAPIYIQVRGEITLPWLIVLLGLVYNSLSVFLLTKIFNIKSRCMIFFISGILTVNVSSIALISSFIHEFDSYMLSILLSILSVYLWKRYEKGYLYGAVSLGFSIGIYQAYISVAISLIVFYFLLELLEGKKVSSLFKRGVTSIVMFVFGGVLYYLALKVAFLLTGIPVRTGAYNSLDTIFHMSFVEILYTTVRAYVNMIRNIIFYKSIAPRLIMFALQIILFTFGAISFLQLLLRERVKTREKLLSCFLVLLLPLVMNIIFILTKGFVHDLMLFVHWFVYIFLIIICRMAVDREKHHDLKFFNLQPAVMMFTFLLLWINIVTGHSVYLKKDLEHKASISLLTRVLYQIEMQDNYVTGETPVVFVGEPTTLLPKQNKFSPLYEIEGNQKTFIITRWGKRWKTQSTFHYLLNNPILLVEEEQWNAMQKDSTIEKMPIYPEKGSIAFVGDVLVVKLGESLDN